MTNHVMAFLSICLNSNGLNFKFFCLSASSIQRVVLLSRTLVSSLCTRKSPPQTVVYKYLNVGECPIVINRPLQIPFVLNISAGTSERREDVIKTGNIPNFLFRFRNIVAVLALALIFRFFCLSESSFQWIVLLIVRFPQCVLSPFPSL